MSNATHCPYTALAEAAYNTRVLEHFLLIVLFLFTVGLKQAAETMYLTFQTKSAAGIRNVLAYKAHLWATFFSDAAHTSRLEKGLPLQNRR